MLPAKRHAPNGRRRTLLATLFTVCGCDSSGKSPAPRVTLVGGCRRTRSVTTLSAGAIPHTVVTQSTLVIGSSITPPPATQGSGTIQNSPHDKCGSLTP